MEKASTTGMTLDVNGPKDQLYYSGYIIFQEWASSLFDRHQQQLETGRFDSNEAFHNYRENLVHVLR